MEEGVGRDGGEGCTNTNLWCPPILFPPKKKEERKIKKNYMCEWGVIDYEDGALGIGHSKANEGQLLSMFGPLSKQK